MSEEEKKTESVKEEEAPKKEPEPKKEAEAKKEEKPLSEKDKKIALYEKQLDELKKQVTEYQTKFEKADKEADAWKNKYYQAYADMSNTRKQVERETADFKKYACQSLIEEMIPTFDSFDMALKCEPKDEVVKKFLEGFKMIHSKLLNALSSCHVEVIDPQIGDDFDHNTMQAFSTVDGEEDDKVANVFTKGYKMYDHLIREAGVIITKKKEEEKTDDTEIEIKDGSASSDSSKESENK